MQDWKLAHSSVLIGHLFSVELSMNLANYRGQPKAGTGYKMLFVPLVFSMSRFQGPSFRCNRIVVIVTLLEAIEGIPDSTKIIIFEGTKTSTIFTRDYFMSENLRVDI